MYLGIDIGSTYTKYAVIDSNKEVLEYEKIKTPANQKEYFDKLILDLKNKYTIESITSCGYGKNNVDSDYKVSELIALAKGVNFIQHDINTVIDIGGQDSKIITIQSGKLVDFIVNDKCAAGAGMYLKMALDRLDISYDELSNCLLNFDQVNPMTTVCAVYAQTEIVSRMAKGENKEEIIKAAVDSVLKQVKNLTMRIKIKGNVTLTGGLSIIPNIKKRLSELLEHEVVDIKYSEFLSAIGGALIGESKE